jgi:hypothetical protein
LRKKGQALKFALVLLHTFVAVEVENCVPDEIQELLAEFNDVLADLPDVLPPLRDIQ